MQSSTTISEPVNFCHELYPRSPTLSNIANTLSSLRRDATIHYSSRTLSKITDSILNLYQISQTLYHPWVTMWLSTMCHELYDLNIRTLSKNTSSIQHLYWISHTLYHPWVTMWLSTMCHELYDLNIRTLSKNTKSIQHLYWISHTLYHPWVTMWSSTSISEPVEFRHEL